MPAFQPSPCQPALGKPTPQQHSSNVGIHPVWLLDPTPCAVHPDQAVLHQIIGKIMITAKKVGQSAQRSSHLDDEPLEGLLIAFPPHHAHDYHTCAARIWLHDRSEL